MNAKLLIALCCALFMGAVPLAGAHLTNPYGSQTSGLLTGHNCRYGGSGPYAPDAPDGSLLWPVKDGIDEFIYPKVDKEDGPDAGDAGCDETRPNNAGGVNPPTWLNSGVSGTYLGAAGIQVESDLFPLTINPLVTFFPAGNFVAATALCDVEVLGQGGFLGDVLTGSPKDDPSDGLLNEPVVDNKDGSGGVAGSSLPGIGTVIGLGLWQEIYKDGTFDDGGFGGACHTSTYTKDDPDCNIKKDNPDCPAPERSYNTYGCFGTSHAEDAVVGPNVWIAAGCDLHSAAADDCINVPFGAPLQECIDSITCNLPPSSCQVDFIECGSDSSTDEINLGEGGGTYYFAHPDKSDTDQEKTGPLHFLHPLFDGKKKEFQLSQGVQYPNIDTQFPQCSDFKDPFLGDVGDGSTAVTYVLDGVEFNVGDVILNALGRVDDPLAPKDIIKTKNGEQTYPNIEYTIAFGGWIDWTNDQVGDPVEDPPENSQVKFNLCQVPLGGIGGFDNLEDLVAFVNDLIAKGPGQDVITCPPAGFGTIDICNVEVTVGTTPPTVINLGEVLNGIGSKVPPQADGPIVFCPGKPAFPLPP